MTSRIVDHRDSIGDNNTETQTRMISRLTQLSESPTLHRNNLAPLSEAEEQSTQRGRSQGESEAGRSTEEEGDNTCIYRDYSNIFPSGEDDVMDTTVRVQKLPVKLNALLSDPTTQLIVSWLPHGRAWKVHNTYVFEEQVIPTYFDATKYNSFVRLVNAWGFRRLTKRADKGSYYHEVSAIKVALLYLLYNVIGGNPNNLTCSCGSKYIIDFAVVSSRTTQPSYADAQDDYKQEECSSESRRRT